MRKAPVFSRRQLLTGNPTGSEEPRAFIDTTCLARNSVACRSCEDACLPSAIRFKPQIGGNYQPDIQQSCTACGDCVDVCPVNAISIVPERNGAPALKRLEQT